MSEEINIVFSTDTTMMREELEEVLDDKEEVEREVKRSVAGMVSSLRATVQMTFLFLQASGVAIDQTLILWAETLFLVLESATLAAAAGGITGGAVLRLGAAIALIFQIRAINTRRSENARTTAAISAGLRAGVSVSL